MIDISQLQEKIYEIGGIIDAPISMLKVKSSPSWDGTPYIRPSVEGYFYIYEERGVAWKEEGPMDEDSVLYLFFEGVVSSMSLDYELKNRVEGQDFRRVYFSHQIELMSKIGIDWSNRRKAYFDEVLKRSPFNDSHP